MSGITVGHVLLEQFQDLIDQRRFYYVLVYACFQILTAFSLAMALEIRLQLIRNLLAFAIVSTFAMDVLSFMITGVGFGYAEYQLWRQELGLGTIPAFFTTYIYAILLACIIIMVGIGLLILHSRHASYKAQLHHIIPLFLCIALSSQLYKFSRSYRIQSIPIVRLTSLIYYDAGNSIYTGPRDIVVIKPRDKLLVKHIVLVVDESARYASVRDGLSDSTFFPFLSNTPNQVFDLGEAVSSTVCSHYSLHSLISGATVDDYPDETFRTLKRASLFEYAKQSVEFTSMYYNQGRNKHLQGYFREADLDAIDLYTNTLSRYPDKLPYDADKSSLALIDSNIQKYSSSFSIIFKFGSHFNYENNYPKSANIYSPTSDPRRRLLGDTVATRNSYKNSLRYAVDGFFNYADSLFIEDDIVFLYTSDHGQNLFDDPGNNITHCVTRGAHLSMASVPLFFYSPDTTIIEKIRRLVPSQNFNRASHAEIGPTILRIFGFESQQIENFAKISLFDSLDSAPRYYMSGDLFGRGQLYENPFDLAKSETAKRLK